MSESPAEPTSGANSEAATEWLTSLLYTSVGLGVLAVNRLQVARRHAQKNFGSSTGSPNGSNPGLDAITELLSDPDKARSVLARVRDELQDIDDRVGGFEHRFVNLVDNLEPDLPDGVREVAGALRDLASDHATQVRAVLGLRIPE